MIFNISEEHKNENGIYCITNKKNNKKYIGQTTESFYKRYLRHLSLLKNNKHFNVHLQRAYNNQSSDDFEMTIVEICNDVLNISRLEEKYIAKYRNNYECYNYLSGGPTMAKENNPFYKKHHSIKSKEKISNARKGKNTGEQNYFYGIDHSGENNGFYGHKHTDEARKKMSIAKFAIYKGENNPFYGKKHTEETKLKLKDNGKNAQKKVICIETGVIYDSIKIAAEKTGSCAKSISAVCRGVRNKANNLHWNFV